MSSKLLYNHLGFEQPFKDLLASLEEKYGEALFDLDGIGHQADITNFSRDFFESSVTADASVDASSNVADSSVIAYTVETPKPLFRLNSYYMLWHYLQKFISLEEANEIIEEQLRGDIYINDFHGVGSGAPYCFNYSTLDVVSNGLPMVDKIVSCPPKHLFAFKSQLEQFVTIAANSTLGATGLADMLISFAFYVKNILSTKKDAHFSFATEEDVWAYVKETLVSFIYTVNQPMRGNQSPFTNISLYDDHFLSSLCDEIVFPDGSNPDKEIVKKIQVLFIDTMNEELRRTPITFPVTTACFAVEDGTLLDEEFNHLISEKNKEFGFINIYMGSTSTLSSCCRLRSSTENEFFNSFGAGSSKIGSLGVCTINLPRLAYTSKSEEVFEERLRHFVRVSAKVNNAKRMIVKKRIETNHAPLYSLGFMELNKQYSTVGVNGLYEAIQFLGYDILSDEGYKYAVRLMTILNEEVDAAQALYKAPHNCEQIPGENASIKLCAKDRYLGFETGLDFYSNQFIPLTVSTDLINRIKIQGRLDQYFSGGSILHLNIEEGIEKTEDLENLTRMCAKAGVVYYAVNYLLNKCENNHMTVGHRDSCTICGAPITGKYTRVVGFLTDVSHWHKVRREKDFVNRVFTKNLEEIR